MTDKRSFLKYGLAAMVPAAFMGRAQADNTPVSDSTQTNRILAILQAQVQKLARYAHIYEEGTWFPELKKNRNISVPLLKYDEATYTRVGNTVFVRIGRFDGITFNGGSGETCLIIGSKGLPGVTNATEFSGQAYIYAGGVPINAIIVKNSYGSTDIYIGWAGSGSAGHQMTFSGIAFSYKVL